MQRTPPALLAFAAATLIRDMDRSALLAHRRLEMLSGTHGTESKEYHDQHALCETIIYRRAELEGYMDTEYPDLHPDVFEAFDMIDRLTNVRPPTPTVL